MLQFKEGDRGDLRDRGSRVELMITEQLGHGFSAFAKTRIMFNGKDASGSNHSGFGQPTTGQLFAGFQHKNYGRLFFGRQPTNGDAIMLGDYQWGGSGMNVLTAEGHKAIHYRSGTYAGFQFGADYLFGQSIKAEHQKGDTKNLKNGYGVALFYDNKFNDDLRFRFRAGYTQDNYDRYNQYNDDGDPLITPINEWTRRTAWRVSGEVTYQSFSIAYNYGEIRQGKRLYNTDLNTIKEKRHFLATRYRITEQVSSYAQYRHNKKIYTNHGYTLGVDYRPIHNFISFVEFGRDRNVNPLKPKQKYVNTYYVGFRVLF
ncbi:porin [Volucribacter psittacicida]|uniref:porin n=1 Tax=Volucribacter psittacicida TaxID=203482 RepID=UPI0010493E97|nr:porin [Volucribacter psittacicida]